MSCALLERWALMLNKVNILNNEVMFNLGLCMMTSLKADIIKVAQKPHPATIQIFCLWESANEKRSCISLVEQNDKYLNSKTKVKLTWNRFFLNPMSMSACCQFSASGPVFPLNSHNLGPVPIELSITLTDRSPAAERCNRGYLQHTKFVFWKE